MKLKTKLYLFQIILSIILFLFLGINYYLYQREYKKDINKYIKNEVKFSKKEILASINKANNEFEKRRKLFYYIHKSALKIVKNKINIDLKKLQTILKNRYHLDDNLNIEIYLLDKNYTIYKTTYPKDLGFNLSIIADAKKFLDKTKKDGKIYVSKFTSTDSLNMGYKLYTYSKLNNDKFLELGFIDNRLNNNAVSLINANYHSSIKVTIYNVAKNDKEYYYYPMDFQKKFKNKEEFFNTIKKVPLSQTTNDFVINVVKNKKPKIIDNGNIQIVYLNIFDKNMYKILGFENLVMKLKIDISDKKKFLDNYKKIFILSLIVISILLIILYIFIQKNFTKPIKIITKSLNDYKKVDDDSILNANDEFAEISKKYNILFEKLNREIKRNETLLKENKRFIADTVHQIRTPLTNIMMNGEMLKEFKSDETISEFIEQIDASINMLSNSYEDLAYITSYDTIQYKPIKVSLSDILYKRVKFFSIISKLNEKEIILNIEDNIFIYINEIELERIIDNNISNAIKYGEDNKPIIISLIKNEDIVILFFKTYGKAIKNKYKVFEKNYREKEAKRGLGLGLNIVKNICNKYNISYEVSYKDGQNIFTYAFKFI